MVRTINEDICIVSDRSTAAGTASFSSIPVFFCSGDHGRGLKKKATIYRLWLILNTYILTLGKYLRY